MFSALNFPYKDYEDLARKTGFDKVSRDKAFGIFINPQYESFSRGLASMVYKCFGETSSRNKMNTNTDTSDHHLADELHK